MSNAPNTLTRLGGVVIAIVGVGCLALGIQVAIKGAEPPLPTGSSAVEGRVLGGEGIELTASPVGGPFLYGLVRVADQPGRNAPHWSGAFGDPEIRVRRGDGEEGEVVTVTLDPPEQWRVLPASRERESDVRSLAGLPIVGEVETEERLNPPFFIDVVALRPGDRVLIESRNGRAVRTFVGERAEHETLRSRRESMRWPMVALLLVLGVVSLLGGTRLVRMKAGGDD